jgi:hypothetical protein
MAEQPGQPAQSTNDDTGSYRYAAVFVLSLTIVVFVISAPTGNWSHAVALALEFFALLVVIATSRQQREIRRTRVAVATVVAAALVILTGTEALPAGVTYGVGGLLVLVIPAALGRGLIRLFRARGVTAQAVAGALAIYLMVGLLFSSAIAVTAEISSKPYFANGTDGTQSQRVYYSFTTMTTTGFGDLTAGIPVGRAIAVVEMLTGQLYLVTVIGLLVGHMSSGRRDSEDPA